MANERKRLVDSVNRVMEALSEMPAEVLVELLTGIPGSSESDADEPRSAVLERFIDEEGPALGQQLTLLSRFSPPIPRLARYERSQESEHADNPWRLAASKYATPTFFPDGLTGVRDAMGRFLKGAGTDNAVAIWATPYQDAEEGKGFIVLLRDRMGIETLTLARKSRLGRLTLPMRQAEFMLADMIEAPATSTKGVATLARQKLGTPESKAELDAAFKAAGEWIELTSDQWQVVVGWLERSRGFREALIAFAEPHASSAVNEGQQLLNMLVTGLTELMRKMKKTHLDVVADVEKQHEKKLTRLRSDLAKTRTISDGIRMRADRSDSEGRRLRGLLKEAERNLAARGATNTSVASATPQDDSVTAIHSAMDDLLA
jgi:hypothetical protein